MSHDLLLGPSQVEVTFIHIQIPIFGKIFQQRVSPHALLTKAFTYSFEGRVALWSRVASMCSLVSDGAFVGQNVPREMFTHNKQLNWNVFFNAHLGCIFFHHAFTQLHFSKKQKNSKYPSAIYYMRGFFIRTQKTNRSNFVMEASWIVQEKGTSTCREWCWQISTALLLWYTISLQLGDEGFNLQRFVGRSGELLNEELYRYTFPLCLRERCQVWRFASVDGKKSSKNQLRNMNHFQTNLSLFMWIGATIPNSKNLRYSYQDRPRQPFSAEVKFLPRWDWMSFPMGAKWKKRELAQETASALQISRMFLQHWHWRNS